MTLVVEPIFPFTGGQDRSVFPLRANRATFHTLANMRQSRDRVGVLEQTPYFYNLAQSAQGTYYAAGSQTEPTASSVRMIAPLPGSSAIFTVSDYVIRQPGLSQYQVFYQTTQPAAETIYTGCLLVINNTSSLNITLGSTLDVEMTGTATFRWRKNGGGYTSGLVPSTAGVSIDSGNATLYFLANTGYAGSETWSWTRTDAAYDNLTYVRDRPLPWVSDNRAVYFCNKNDRVMKLTAASGGGYYAISVGYRAIYASQLMLFSDHLYLQDAGLAASAVASRVHVIKNSDKTDYDNFIATDVNEADSQRLPVLKVGSDRETTGIGMAVINKYLYVFTGSEIFYSPDYGLPIVTSFDRLANFDYSIGDVAEARGIVQASHGVFIFGDRATLFFNGQSAQRISDPVVNITNVNGRRFGVYDSVNDELISVDDASSAPILTCYQMRRGTWHTRAAHFDTSSPVGPTSLFVGITGILYVGKRSRTLLAEDPLWGLGGGVPVADTTGTTFAVPTVITQATATTLWNIKEVSGVYIGAIFNYVSYSPSSSYAATANRRFVVSWYTSTTGDITGSPTTNASAYVDSSKPDGLVSFPRLAARTVAFQITITDSAAAKPPASCVLTTIEPCNYVESKASR